MNVDTADTKEQFRLCYGADRRILDRCKTFNEIMTSDNPLTPDEVEKLIARRPHYSMFAAWVKK